MYVSLIKLGLVQQTIFCSRLCHWSLFIPTDIRTSSSLAIFRQRLRS